MNIYILPARLVSRLAQKTLSSLIHTLYHIFLLFSRHRKKTVDLFNSLCCSGNVLLSRAVSRQVPSALRSLTSVFGMGTGGTSSLLSPDIQLLESYQLNNAKNLVSHSHVFFYLLRSSPRPISINQLNMSPCLHL